MPSKKNCQLDNAIMSNVGVAGAVARTVQPQCGCRRLIRGGSNLIKGLYINNLYSATSQGGIEVTFQP